MSRVRAPGGALRRTVFEDIESLGDGSFFVHFTTDQVECPSTIGGEVLSQNWSQIGRKMVADEINIVSK